MNHALGHCIHYDADARFALRGSRSGACQAGVAYSSVRLPEPVRRPGRLPVVLPCTADARELDQANTCPCRVWPTPEQVAEAEAETERATEAVMRGECPQCGAVMVRRDNPSGGYTARCPHCPDVGVMVCARKPRRGRR